MVCRGNGPGSAWCTSVREEQTISPAHAYLQMVVALLGIIGNFLSSLILARKAMRNSFNILLVALALFDTTYLVSHVPYENHKLAPICKKRL